MPHCKRELNSIIIFSLRRSPKLTFDFDVGQKKFTRQSAEKSKAIDNWSILRTIIKKYLPTARNQFDVD